MLDHTTDASHESLFKIGSLVVLPDFVKDAALSTPEDTRQLPADSFAHPEARMYPVHTPADTWLSTAYFTKQAQEYPEGLRNEISSRLLTAIDFWDIKDSFKYEAEKLTKEAAAPVMTISYKHKDMEEANAHVCTFDDFQKIASDLLKCKEKYPWDTRRDVAKQLLQAPAEFVSKLSAQTVDALEKTACMQKAALATVKQVVADRKSYYYRQGYVENAKQLMTSFAEIEKLASSEVMHEDLLDKTASLIDDMDRLSGLHTRGYSPRIAAPEDAFRGISEKQAKAVKSHILVLPNGKKASTAELNKESAAVVEFCKAAMNCEITKMEDLTKLSAQSANMLCLAFPKIVS